ncbi:F-box/WD repeat-containing protein 7 [Geodia barretti]|uniref:F-box/WD repeat-containing protein 7 n=1 Tax=Geodia barretti TaxID=519541 RepID=A0AA35U3W8_GEOBA|nr:F-box/WD repeat-containing protein 7 [Geodia barretti]
MLLNLLDQCNCAQLHLLSIHMEPNLHGLCPLNCQDLLSWLPSNLAFFILSFLDPVSLCRASQVCRIWYHMANDCRLWMKFCRLRVWQLSQTGEDKQRNKHVSVDGRIMWKAMFSEGLRDSKDWWLTRVFCLLFVHVRTFEGTHKVFLAFSSMIRGSSVDPGIKLLRCGIDAQILLGLP